MAKLLIIENDPDVAELLVGYFVNHPTERYEVGSTSTAQSALSAILADPSFDLVITTNHLGDMKGVDLFAKIKEVSPDLPVILISGLPVSPLPKGISAFYEKPFDIEELGCAVKRLIAQKQPT